MNRYRVIVALVVVFVLEACGATTPTPSSSALAVAQPSAVASPAGATTDPTATPLPSEKPLPTASPSPTPAPTPVPWQKYTSKRNRYTMKYPPEWIVTPGSAKIADQFDKYGSPWVFVSRDVLSGGTVSIPITAAHTIAYYKSHYRGKLLSSKNLKVAGWSGRLLIFSGFENGIKMQFQDLHLAKGRVSYFIEMDSYFASAKADKTLFKQIYSTFRPK